MARTLEMNSSLWEIYLEPQKLLKTSAPSGGLESRGNRLLAFLALKDAINLLSIEDMT